MTFVANVTSNVHIKLFLADFHIRRWRGVALIKVNKSAISLTAVDTFKDTLGSFHLFFDGRLKTFSSVLPVDKTGMLSQTKMFF